MRKTLHWIYDGQTKKLKYLVLILVTLMFLKITGSQQLEFFNYFLNIWCRRKLTLHGKLTVLNSLATSAIVYLSNIIELPEKCAKQIDTDFRLCFVL